MWTSLLMVGCSSLAGEIVWSDLVFEEQYTTYELNVYLPDNIEAMVDLPWLLMLDGDVGFYDAAQLVEESIVDGGQPFILVGLGQQATRNRDYTPTTTSDEEMSGGLEAFFSFVESEVIPSIEQTYAVSQERSHRSITGHSYGGLATIWALYHRRSLFAGYGATSPALWWDRGIPFDWLREQSVTEAPLDVELYLSMGQLEMAPMNVLFDLFVAELTVQDPAGWSVQSEVLYGHEHYSSWSPAMSAFVQYRYGRP